MSETEKRVPELRFKGFLNAWEQRKLGELMDISSASRVHKNEWTKSGVRFFRTSDVVASYNKKKNTEAFISQELYEELSLKSGKVSQSDILITGGGSIGIPYLIKDEEPLYFKDADLIWLKNSGKLNGYFLFTFFVTNGFRQYLGSISHIGTISHYTIEQAKVTPISLPNEEEQNKIGTFFEKLDNTIALHQRKLNLLNRLKKTYMDALFPQNDENIPVLRFVVFSEPWEQRALKEVSERVRGNDGRMNLPTLTISAGSGWLDQRERFSGNIAGNEQKNYTLLSKGELSYNHGNSKLAKYGTVFALRTYNEALVPRVYHSFRTTDEASADFVEFMFATKRPDRELAKLVSSGARMDGLLNINYDDFSEINIMIPKIDEQNRISDFLRKFDETITLQQQKIDNIKTLKSILLDKMFI